MPTAKARQVLSMNGYGVAYECRVPDMERVLVTVDGEDVLFVLPADSGISTD